MSENVITEAVSDAMRWQVDARNRDDSLAPEDLYKEGARSLGSSGASTAVALLAVAGLAPVPLGDGLKPSAGPLTSFESVYNHFRARHHDGCGVALGEHPGGVVLVGQKCTAAAWRRWQAAEGVEVSRRINDYGQAAEELTLLPMPRFTSLTWQPPASPLRSTGVHVGQSAIAAAGRALGRDSTPGEPGWVLYAATSVDGVPLTFRDRRADGFGVSVQATGTVPLHARRPSGTTLVASGVPQAEDMPAWLVAALGGKPGRRVAA